jgi:serpin B
VKWISEYLRRIIPAGLLLTFGIRLAPAAPAPATQALVEGNTAFALDLYGRLKGGPPNIFFSPYSVSTCLAMTYGGARGDTAKQMARVLHFGSDQKQVSESFASLQRQLNGAGGQGSNQFEVANALWAQQAHPFRPEFLAIARDQYQANIDQADFKTSAEAVRSKINQWVAQKTQERIKDVLPPGSVDAMTRLVLANAIYFKGAWAVPFRETETRPQAFHLSQSSQVQVPMMHQSESVRYMEDENLQAVEIPYSGNRLSMIVLLPRRISGCGDLEARLTPGMLARSLAQMKQQKVEIFLPRFKQDSAFELNGSLAKMGMPDAFGPDADFSGMDGTRQLFISGVFHKAWVEVNEQGTEAAAATVTTMKALSIARPLAPPPVFRADHPFIFMIRDMREGSILFLGRLAQPST